MCYALLLGKEKNIYNLLFISTSLWNSEKRIFNSSVCLVYEEIINEADLT